MSNQASVFDHIKVRANGLLDPGVYRAIHSRAQGVRGDVLEIGTAHGAATIAVALGAPKETRIQTIDRLEGGTRSTFGSVDQNRRIVLKNFSDFGVADRIDLHVGSVEDVAGRIESTTRFGMLILDADGAIDRDFALFYGRLDDGASIIIDDYRPGFVNLTPERGEIVVDQKHRLTAALVELFERGGLIEREALVKDTYFGRKPTGAQWRPDMAAILAVYRSLTFGRGRLRSGLFSRLSWGVATRAPRLHLRLKRLAGRVVE